MKPAYGLPALFLNGSVTSIVYFIIATSFWSSELLRAGDTNGGETGNWWRNKVENGLAVAQYNIGVAYDNGGMLTKNPAEAAKYYREAADQGIADAQLNLGFLYYWGTGVPKDRVEAVKWWRKAAEQGLDRGQYELGYAYVNGIGVSRDLAEGYAWWSLAAKQGDPAAVESRNYLEAVMPPPQLLKAKKRLTELEVKPPVR